jgi:hypothetical protein
MRTYRELFGAPEFTPLFVTSSVQVAATVVAGLALGTLVYAATHSPLLSALSMFGPSLAQMVGATALLSADATGIGLQSHQYRQHRSMDAPVPPQRHETAG